MDESAYVAVITGASSGIGRATALSLARRGATVALLARRAQALDDAAAECERLGGRARAITCDVTDEGQVKTAAELVLAEFGHIDLWVNNAGVTLFSRFEETPSDAFRRVLETNLFGYVHGARAALPIFRRQGRGVLINVASQVANFGQPYTSAYVASKFAIRGLGESLRQELRDVPDIHVCTLMPASIDTPLFQHGANLTGRAVQPLPPLVRVERVAEKIVHLARHPRREAFVGVMGTLATMEHGLMPGLTERMIARQVEKNHFQDTAAASSLGNLFEPGRLTTTDGGWRARRRPARRRTLAASTAVALLAIPAALLAWRARA